jgi:hypothetical protein
MNKGESTIQMTFPAALVKLNIFPEVPLELDMSEK